MVSFCPVGQSLSIIFSDNSLGVLDLETSKLSTCSQTHHFDSAVLTMNWTCVDFLSNSNCYVQKTHFLTNCAQAGGYYQTQHSGMHDVGDSSSGEIHKDLSSQLAKNGLILLSVCQSGRIFGHAFGIYLLFVLNDYPNSNRIFQELATKSMSCYASETFAAIISSHKHPQLNKNTFCLSRFFDLSSFYTHWHVVKIKRSLTEKVSELYGLLSECGRKWRDACKIVVPKLSLLTDLLETYQLHLTPVQFLHSISLCGMWHPAAIISFSQHWNDQGITRLKSAVDTAAAFVVNTLSLTAIPLATSISLSSR
jgi:hypothetical protein